MPFNFCFLVGVEIIFSIAKADLAFVSAPVAAIPQAREAAGLTQEEVARRLNTTKSAISRIENHADDVRLSALKRYAEAVGTNLHIKLARAGLFIGG